MQGVLLNHRFGHISSEHRLTRFRRIYKSRPAQFTLNSIQGVIAALASALSRGAPKPASAGRSKPASAVTHIPHPFGSPQHLPELSAVA
jgi:hypothetical protein